MRVWRQPLFVAALLVAAFGPAHAQELKLFDAHMHYNQEPDPFYSVDKVLETFRRNGVTGILATSRPNKGTRQLVEAKAKGLWIVPFIRPYRERADIKTWFEDPTIFDLIEAEYKRGYYRGIGEFHIYGDSAAGPLVKKVVDFAVAHDLYLHAHCDEEALRIFFAHNPKVKIIWAHTGFSVPPKRVAALFDKYPALWGELSYRSGITQGGQLTPTARDLFTRYSDRFLIGSDTWIDQRWADYDGIMRDYREWLAQLPPEHARRIAYGNAERLFGARKAE